MRVLRRGTACAVQVPTRSMTAATAHNQRRESGSRTAPATQNGAESAIQGQHPDEVRAQVGGGRGRRGERAGPVSANSIGTTNSHGLLSNACAIPAFMNRPRPITVTVTACVRTRSMSSRVTSNVVNAQTPHTAMSITRVSPAPRQVRYSMRWCVS